MGAATLSDFVFGGALRVPSFDLRVKTPGLAFIVCIGQWRTSRFLLEGIVLDIYRTFSGVKAHDLFFFKSGDDDVYARFPS